MKGMRAPHREFVPERAGDVANFARACEELVTHYDFVVNTDQVSVERAVSTIVTAATV